MDAIASDVASYSDYTFGKIAHLKRAGLVSAAKAGRGQNGGACPDWLVEQQNDDRKRLQKLAERQHARGRAYDDGI